MNTTDTTKTASAQPKRIAELELACSQILQCLKHHFSPHDRHWCVARLEQICNP